MVQKCPHCKKNITSVELKDIDSIELSTAEIAFDAQTRKLSVLGSLESHNTVIHLKILYHTQIPL